MTRKMSDIIDEMTQILEPMNSEVKSKMSELLHEAKEWGEELGIIKCMNALKELKKKE